MEEANKNKKKNKCDVCRHTNDIINTMLIIFDTYGDDDTNITNRGGPNVGRRTPGSCTRRGFLDVAKVPQGF